MMGSFNIAGSFYIMDSFYVNCFYVNNGQLLCKGPAFAMFCQEAQAGLLKVEKCDKEPSTVTSSPL